MTFGQLDAGRHPNLGALVQDGQSGYTSVCSGTLMAEDVFLTAARCLAGVEAFDLGERLRHLDTDLTDGITGVLAGEGVLHELYASGGADNSYDIAVVLLEEPVTGLDSAVLPRGGLARPTERRAPAAPGAVDGRRLRARL